MKASTVQSIERVMKTAIVDKNPSVSSAALVSAYHLLPIARDVVKRWQSETQEAAASTKSSGGFSLGFSSSSGSRAREQLDHDPVPRHRTSVSDEDARPDGAG